MGLNPHVVGRFFREEGWTHKIWVGCLNPHVVGRFFRVEHQATIMTNHIGLNPHVVGRFFRVLPEPLTVILSPVLIPMWWGGFSEKSCQIT